MGTTSCHTLQIEMTRPRNKSRAIKRTKKGLKDSTSFRLGRDLRTPLTAHVFRNKTWFRLGHETTTPKTATAEKANISSSIIKNTELRTNRKSTSEGIFVTKSTDNSPCNLFSKWRAESLFPMCNSFWSWIYLLLEHPSSSKNFFELDSSFPLSETHFS